MSHVALRLEPLGLAGLDEQLCALGPLRLVRADGGLFVECEGGAVARARSRLARAGARAPEATLPSRAPGLVPAVAGDLDPVRADGLVDVVWIRPLGAGEASRRYARSLPWRRHVDPAALRAILHGEPTFSWRRVVWAPRRALRALRSVRPVVFDRDALMSSEERVAFARDARLERWAS